MDHTLLSHCYFELTLPIAAFRLLSWMNAQAKRTYPSMPLVGEFLPLHATLYLS